MQLSFQSPRMLTRKELLMPFSSTLTLESSELDKFIVLSKATS